MPVNKTPNRAKMLLVARHAKVILPHDEAAQRPTFSKALFRMHQRGMAELVG